MSDLQRGSVVELPSGDAEVLAKALDEFFRAPRNNQDDFSSRRDLWDAVNPTLQALGYGKD